MTRPTARARRPRRRAREYWDTLYREAPPWNSDPDQAHWRAAVRAARAKAQADDGPPERA
ncbi:hypothetical protein WME97_36300 [Sorangium sp. So ce367]|uniref:hypothetical protein n=1 Tax=Sorangium sp. So ce367 TaxID=3133305 RepID=UPI003F64105F